MARSHILGLPRIGKKRELKFALEQYWKGEEKQSSLLDVASRIRVDNWETSHQSGLDYITVGDFAFYDQVLNASILLGVVPRRFKERTSSNTLDDYFRMARGSAPTGSQVNPCEMTKWFNTNYHYIVPELVRDQEFELNLELLKEEINLAKKVEAPLKLQLIGPVTYLWLSKEKEPGFNRLSLLPELIDAYKKLLLLLHAEGVEWVQIEEPVLVLDLAKDWIEAIATAYTKLDGKQRPKLLLTSYFGHIDDKHGLINALPVDGIHLDLVAGGWQQLEQLLTYWPKDRVISLGVVNGRNIWRNDLRKTISRLQPLADSLQDQLWVSTSCSLLHCPVDVNSEQRLESTIKKGLAFAEQKIKEVALITQGLNSGLEAIAEAIEESNQVVELRQSSDLVHDKNVQKRVAKISSKDRLRTAKFSHRKEEQKKHFNFPLLPTTTIGSFPQTASIRQARKSFKAGEIPEEKYTQLIKDEIRFVVKEQEQLGFDVLVHGEAERNDMVEYFGEQLNGFAFTDFGWVQSYGSRCVKPPIIYGDISRKQSITVDWSVYAQSLTSKKVKGMLTGPTTILAWSFEREDISNESIATQIGLALRDEVLDLESQGVEIIQIDEPAFRELLPLRKSGQQDYLNWSVNAFRLCSAPVKNTTQIHTHMCYSEFNEIMESIALLDADVITIESSRSDMELLQSFEDFKYPNDIGPGVYDIHSPRIPDKQEIVSLLEAAANKIPVEQLWVNPDCGLKTRTWDEVKPALENLLGAAKEFRDRLDLN